MTSRYAAAIALVLFAAGCAELRDQRANVKGNTYLECLNRAADEYMNDPAGAEQIATAAHAKCWSEWTAYRGEIQKDYIAGAKTPEELQLGRDKADAYLRQFETDARKAVMTRVVQRTYGVPTAR